MTPEEITALIQSSQAEFKTTLMTEVTEAINVSNRGVAASITKSNEKALEALKASLQTQSKEQEVEQVKEQESKLTLKAMQTQIEQLKTELTEKEAARYASEADSVLTSVVASSGTNNAKILKQLLSTEYAGRLKQEGNNWFVEDGDNAISLSDSVKAYLATEDGAFFLPPSNIKGSGSTETKAATPQSTAEKTTLSSMLADIKAGTGQVQI